MSRYGLFDLAGNSVTFASIGYEARVHQCVADVSAELVYQNDTEDDLDVYFCYPHTVNETTYTVYSCEASSEGDDRRTECATDDASLQTVTSGGVDLPQIEPREDEFRVVLGQLKANSEMHVSLKVAFELPLDHTGKLVFMMPDLYTGGNDIDIDLTAYVSVTDLKAVTQYGWDIVSAKGKDPEQTDMNWPTQKVTLKENTAKRVDVGFTIELKQHGAASVVLEPSIYPAPGVVSSPNPQTVMLCLDPMPSTGPSNCGEFIFIVDRSGSMGGTDMNHAKQTLLLFLKSLPIGCYFNVVSFGSRYELLFKNGSQVYDNKTLGLAIKLQESMDANFGGTNLCAPMKDVLQRKAIPGHPRYVFAMTDGAVWDDTETEKVVKAHIGSARICAFGIGTGADHRFMKSLAEIGNGIYEFVQGIDRTMESKVMNALRQMMENSGGNIQVEWFLEKGQGSLYVNGPQTMTSNRRWIAFAKLSDYVESKQKKKKLSNYVKISCMTDGVNQTQTVILNNCQKTIKDSTFLHRMATAYHIEENYPGVGEHTAAAKKAITKLAMDSGHLQCPYVATVCKSWPSGDTLGVVREPPAKPPAPKKKASVRAAPAFQPTGGAAKAPAARGARAKLFNFRDNLSGALKKTTIRRIAHRGGVLRMSSLTYEETRGALKQFLEKIIRDAVLYAENGKRKSVIETDIDCSLKKNGINIYGIEEPAPYRFEEVKKGRRARRRPVYRRTTPIGRPNARSNISTILGVNASTIQKRKSQLSSVTSLRKTASTASQKSSGGHGSGSSPDTVILSRTSSSTKSTTSGSGRLTKAASLRKSVSNASTGSAAGRATLSRKSTLVLSSEETPSGPRKRKSVHLDATEPAPAKKVKAAPKRRGKATQKTKGAAVASTSKTPLASSQKRSTRTPKGGAATGKVDFTSMVTMITLQTFDGTWDLSKELGQIIGKSTMDLVSAAPFNNLKIWATALSITWLEKYFPQARMEWEMIHFKAINALKAADLHGMSTDDLQKEAAKYV